eukprot:scaffold4510_cov183-Amphora_coffeaeformis.AAC.85
MAASCSRCGFLLIRKTFLASLFLWLTRFPFGQAHFSTTTHQDEPPNIFAHDQNGEDHGHHGGCGAQAISMADEQIQQLRLEQQFHLQEESGESATRGGSRRLVFPSCHELCHQCITVPVRVHMLVTELENYNEEESLSSISPVDVAESFRRNLVLLNQAFEDTPFVFEWDDVYRIMPHPQAAWNALNFRQWIGTQHQNDDTMLHVYLAHQLAPVGNDGGVLFGFGTFPNAQATGDGVYLRYDVVTGGGWPGDNMDLGYWLIHETGHWLGLLHSFQTYLNQPAEEYNCQPNEVGFGDFVNDTPLQRGPSVDQDCKAHLGKNAPALDTCPNLPGPDAIFNYMNYVDDHICWARQGEFTCGQKERMYAHWMLFREHASSCEDEDEMELELLVALDGFHKQENRIILFSDEDGTLYDSFSDHPYSLQIVDGPILIDLCVPRIQSYTLTAQDTIGNGFNWGGKVELYVDRVLAATIEGDFGSSTVIPIVPATSQPSPSLIAEVITGSSVPSQFPSTWPSQFPSTWPSQAPMYTTSNIPSHVSSSFPSLDPTERDLSSLKPSSPPSSSLAPTVTVQPSGVPTIFPSDSPTVTPFPSLSPTLLPSDLPSLLPSVLPSPIPTFAPSDLPSSVPTTLPPSVSPAVLPSTRPTITSTVFVPSWTPILPDIEQSREENSSVGTTWVWKTSARTLLTLCMAFLYF